MNGLSTTAWSRPLRHRLFWWFYEADIGLWVALVITVGLALIVLVGCSPAPAKAAGSAGIVVRPPVSMGHGNLYLVRDNDQGVICYVVISIRQNGGNAISCLSGGH